MFTFFGQTMIERACAIALQVAGVERIVLATGDRPENQVFKPYAAKMGVEFFVGSEDNVLKRYCDAISGYSGEYLLRMTADNYLIQPDVLEAIHRQATQNKADYAFVLPLSHFGGEIIRCDTLRASLARNYSLDAKEHVSWDIRNDVGAKKATLPQDLLGIDHGQKIALDDVGDLVQMKRLEEEFEELQSCRCVEAVRRVQRNWPSDAQEPEG